MSEQRPKADRRTSNPLTRRQVLVGGLAAALGVAAGCSDGSGGREEAARQPGGGPGPVASGDAGRREEAYRIRVEAARAERDRPPVEHLDNGDEERYPDRIASYSKCLPHDDLGVVDGEAYEALLRALRQGRGFADVPRGGETPFENPQAAFAFNLEGPDPHALGMPAAPAFANAEAAGEMVEAYWQALARDVPFARYGEDPLADEAARDLSGLEDFRGARDAGRVTSGTLFRGLWPGEQVGPYVSQFIWKTVPYGQVPLEQRYRVPVAGDDHMTSYEEWLAIQRGGKPARGARYDDELRYIRNGRDLAESVHGDFAMKWGTAAALTLFGYESRALSPDNPYYGNPSELGFATFGSPHILDLAGRVANDALKAAWFQKWLVHRRLRPEAFSGRAHNVLVGRADYPIHPDLLDSPALERVSKEHDAYLLPMGFPEGSPAHGTYPSGHATWVGAVVTVLKACFDEEFVIPDPVVANESGTALKAYDGEELTVGGELNKLASNIAIGRNFGGVHYRSDATEGMRLGESVALGVLRDMKATYREDEFTGFFLTGFNGELIKI